MSLLLLGALAFVVYLLLKSKARRVSAPKELAGAVAAVAAGLLAVFALARQQVLPAVLLALCILVILGTHKKLLARARALFGGVAAEPWIELAVDPRTGQSDGVVRTGSFQGRRLSDLGLDELLGVLTDCRVWDAGSASALETYLDHRYGMEWRRRAAARTPSGNMTRAEALEILGLAEGASPDAIKEAHHRLILKLHPDQGGSTYLATQLNRARDVLLD